MSRVEAEVPTANLVPSGDKAMVLLIIPVSANKLLTERSLLQEKIGEEMVMDGGWAEGIYTVTAVLETVPQNSHLEFDFLLSLHDVLTNRQYERDNGWRWSNFMTYVMLNPDNQPQFYVYFKEVFNVKINYFLLSKNIYNSMLFANYIYFFLLYS